MANMAKQKKTLYFALWDAHLNFLNAGGTIPCPIYGAPKLLGSASAGELRDIIKNQYDVEVSGTWIKEFRESRGLTKKKLKFDIVLSKHESAIIDALQGPPGKVVGVGFTETGRARLNEPAFLFITCHEDGLYHVKKADTITLHWVPKHMPRFTLEEVIHLLRVFCTLKDNKMHRIWNRLTKELNDKTDCHEFTEGGYTFNLHLGKFKVSSNHGCSLESSSPIEIIRCFGYHYVPALLKSMAQAARSQDKISWEA